MAGGGAASTTSKDGATAASATNKKNAAASTARKSKVDEGEEKGSADLTPFAVVLNSLFFMALLQFLYRVLMEAYRIRLYAIEEYGRVIHEFDPYFNYRATEYLWANGWDKFSKWFDYKGAYSLAPHRIFIDVRRRRSRLYPNLLSFCPPAFLTEFDFLLPPPHPSLCLILPLTSRLPYDSCYLQFQSGTRWAVRSERPSTPVCR